MVTTPCQPEQPRRHHGNKRLLHTKELTPLQVTSADEKVSPMRLLIILCLAQNITFNLEEFHFKEHIIFLATSFRLVYLTIVPERWALLVSHDVSAPFPSTCHLIVYGFSTSPNLNITKNQRMHPTLIARMCFVSPMIGKQRRRHIRVSDAYLFGIVACLGLGSNSES